MKNVNDGNPDFIMGDIELTSGICPNCLKLIRGTRDQKQQIEDLKKYISKLTEKIKELEK